MADKPAAKICTCKLKPHAVYCELAEWRRESLPFQGGSLTFESLPTNLASGDMISKDGVGEPLSREAIARHIVSRMEWPTNTDPVEAMDWQLDGE